MEGIEFFPVSLVLHLHGVRLDQYFVSYIEKLRSVHAKKLERYLSYFW